MIDAIFDVCKWLLIVSAARLGMSYQAINVWIFVILWPIFTLALIAVIFWQHLRIRNLLRQSSERPIATPR